jgi:hypothetical protein
MNEGYWTATIKVVVAVPAHETNVPPDGPQQRATKLIGGALEAIGTPMLDCAYVADWGFARNGEGRAFFRPAFGDPRVDGCPEDFLALRDAVERDQDGPTPDFEVGEAEQVKRNEEYERIFDSL